MKIKYVLLQPLKTYKHHKVIIVIIHQQQSIGIGNAQDSPTVNYSNSKPVKHAMSLISLNHSHLKFNHLIRCIAISVFYSQI